MAIRFFSVVVDALKAVKIAICRLLSLANSKHARMLLSDLLILCISARAEFTDDHDDEDGG